VHTLEFIANPTTPQNRPITAIRKDRPMRFILSLIAASVLTVAGTTDACAWSDKKFVYRADGKRLSEVLQDFAAAQSVPVVIDAGVEGAVNAEFNTKPEDFLGALSKSYGLIWYFDGVTLFVYPSRMMTSRVFRMRGYDREQVKQMLNSLGLGDSRFPLRFNENEQTLLAYGPPRHIELVQTVIDTLDGGARDRVGKAIQVFPLKYAFAADRVFGNSRTPGLASTLNSIFGGDRPSFLKSAPSPDSLLGRSGGSASGDKRRSAELTFGLKSPEAGTVPGARKDGVRDGAGRLLEGESATHEVDNEQPYFQPDEATNSIIVRGVPERMKQYEALIQQLDVAQDLVEIEASIIDVSSDEVEGLGVSWDFTGSRSRAIISPDSPGAAATVDSLANITTVVSNAGRTLLARVRALEGTGKAHILARPKVLGAANRISSMTDKRVASVRVAGNLDVNLFTVEAGTTLQVLPQVVQHPDRRDVRLSLMIEDGSFEGAVVDSVPVIKRTEIRTEATIREGEALLVGGISVESDSNTRSGVPGLSRIPGLGALFRHDETTKRRSERMFLITPKIVTAQNRPQPTAPAQVPPAAPASSELVPVTGALSVAMTPLREAPPAPVAPPDCPALALGLGEQHCKR
jgi:type III secretion protein C